MQHMSAAAHTQASKYASHTPLGHDDHLTHFRSVAGPKANSLRQHRRAISRTHASVQLSQPACRATVQSAVARCAQRAALTADQRRGGRLRFAEDAADRAVLLCWWVGKRASQSSKYQIGKERAQDGEEFMYLTIAQRHRRRKGVGKERLLLLPPSDAGSFGDAVGAWATALRSAVGIFPARGNTVSKWVV